MDPECLHSTGEPDIARPDASSPCLNLIDLSLADEGFQFPTSYTGARMQAEKRKDTRIPQVNACRKRVCQQWSGTRALSRVEPDSSETYSGATQRRTRGRKTPHHGEHFLEKELTQKQMTQLQELADRTALVPAGDENLARDPQSMILATFALLVGRSSSQSFLNSLIEGYWTDQVSTRRMLNSDPMNMSMANRIQEIQTLDCKITFHCFLRAFHLYKLVSENRYGLQEAEGPFLITGIERPTLSVSNAPGNPRIKARARLYESMMKDLWPQLSKGHPSYDKKYRDVVQMCKISRRLGQLASCFGVGIFGLVPLEGRPTDLLLGLLDHA